MTELLRDQNRLLGPLHRDTLLSRHYLAKWQGEQADPSGALAAFTALVDDMTQALGPDDRETLASRLELAAGARRPAT